LILPPCFVVFTTLVCAFPDVAVLAFAIVISLISSYISKLITLNTLIFIKWIYSFGGQIMKQALANLIHVKSEEKQIIPKSQAIPIVPINPNKQQIKLNPTKS
jgi:hypothetical protein